MIPSLLSSLLCHQKRLSAGHNICKWLLIYPHIYLLDKMMTAKETAECPGLTDIVVSNTYGREMYVGIIVHPILEILY